MSSDSYKAEAVDKHLEEGNKETFKELHRKRNHELYMEYLENEGIDLI